MAFVFKLIIIVQATLAGNVPTVGDRRAFETSPFYAYNWFYKDTKRN
jgi:hypothetical protein